MLLMLGLWLFNVTLQICFNVIPIKIDIFLPLTGDNVKRSTAVGSRGFPAGCEEECLLYRRCRSLQREEWGESERRSCWWLSKSKCSGKSIWKWRHKNNGKIWGVGVLSKNNRKKGLHVVSAHVSFWSFYPDSFLNQFMAPLFPNSCSAENQRGVRIITQCELFSRPPNLVACFCPCLPLVW